MAPERRRRHPVLGVVAYVLVPGERRTRAAGHFRRAGVEALRGFAALARPARGDERRTETGRQRIEVE